MSDAGTGHSASGRKRRTGTSRNDEQVEPGIRTGADFTVPLRYLRSLIGKGAFDAATARLGLLSTVPENARLSSITFCNLCLEHIRASRDESLGQPQTVPFGNFALLMAAAAQGCDLADVLRRCVRAMRILRPDLVAKVRVERTGLLFSIRSIHPSTPAIEVGLEFLFLSFHCALRWMMGATLRPQHARISRRFPGYERSLLSVLRCPLVPGGQGMTIYYSAADARQPIKPVKYESWAAHELPEYVRLLQEAADEMGSVSVTSDLSTRVRRLMLDGVKGQANISSHLGMSEATLRRRLAETGRSFRNILDQARQETADRLLLSEMPFADIASELGFSDVRSFRRACVRWFGATPAKFRRLSEASC